MAKQRKSVAATFEKLFLDNMMDVDVWVSGKENEIITFKYVLWSRPLVRKFMNDDNFYGGLKRQGFKKAVFYDGYNYSWTYKIN
jgi:hypothetical protein